MLAQSISKNSLILGAFALVTAGVLAFTYLATASKIAVEEKRAAEKALLEIVPASRIDNDLLTTTWSIPQNHLAELGLSKPENIHIATKQGQFVAAIIPALTPDGYSGDIKLIIGVNDDGSVAGVRTLVHKETPGLGDKVDVNKSNWILSFNAKSLTNPETDGWAVKKDGGQFDQFTGATITPRAVVKRVRSTLEYFQQHKASILQSLQLQATQEQQAQANAK